MPMHEQLMAWSANERVIVVEHLLLRPKFPGDALYPACCEGGCKTCGDEDPYSFRLTFVMPGWMPQYTDNLDLRRFAERTIQQETPSHLLGKTCWVGNDGFIENPCDEVIGDLAELLIAEGLDGSGGRARRMTMPALARTRSITLSALSSASGMRTRHSTSSAPMRLPRSSPPNSPTVDGDRRHVHDRARPVACGRKSKV